MTERKKKGKSTGKRRGGQSQNQNARKHGLWAKDSPAKLSGEATVKLNVIEARRNKMDDVVEELYGMFFAENDVDRKIKIANALSLGITAANGCDRTIAITTGKLTNLQEAIERLLAEEDPDDPSTIKL